MFEGINPTEKATMTEVFRKTGSQDKNEALAAQKVMAAAIQEPLRQGILVGDNIAGIFTPTVFEPYARIEYPIDLFRPDNASEFAAYTIPNQGKIPQRQVEGDYITVPTYDIGNSIDMLLRYAREARWDVVSRALAVMEAGFTKKLNDDGWHVLLASGFDRNVIVTDSNANAGQFTKRLVSLLKLVMRRNGGGNASSINPSQLTHLFVSPEALEDMRNWGIDQADEFTRREIYLSDDGNTTGGTEVFGVKIVPLLELGAGQEYENYYTGTIAAGAANSGRGSSTDVEMVIGLDLNARDSFVMPVREELQVFEDETLHRSRKMGYYSWMSAGFASLNSNRTLLGSL